MISSTPVLSTPMAVETRFGRFEVRDDAVIVFADGLPGFEQCRRFVLLSSEDLAPLWCLQGLDAPEPSFLAVDPTLVLPRYRRVLSDADRARLGDDDAALAWLALVTVGATDGDTAVVNLRAPIVVNTERMVGAQVVSARGHYQINHPLAIG
jgi:flagellar assembly factor FliW